MAKVRFPQGGPVEWAVGWAEAGYQPLPITGKGPMWKGWQLTNCREPRLVRAMFREYQHDNVGLLLCDGLVDADLDCPEAIQLRHLWPSTDLYFFRTDVGTTHLLYRASDLPPHGKSEFVPRLLDGTEPIELRFSTSSAGKQVMAPGSRHPDPPHEPILMATWPPPQPADTTLAHLRRTAGRIALVIQFKRLWPGPGIGQSHDYALALLGGLLQVGCEPALARRMVVEAAQLAGDKDAQLRATHQDAERALVRIQAEEPVRGFPWLEGEYGCAGLGALVRELGQWRTPATNSPTTKEQEPRKKEKEPGGHDVRVAPAAEDCLAAVRMSEVQAVPIQWLWPGRVPLGRLTLLAGREGLGKSLLTADLAARLSQGRGWPEGATPVRETLFITAEDDPADTLRPRLDAAGADCEKIHYLRCVQSTNEAGELTESWWTLAHCQLLDNWLAAHPQVAQVIVDPIGSYLGGLLDAYRDNEVRSALMPLHAVCEGRNCAAVLVAHIRKAQGGHANDMILGSRAFTALARSVLHLVEDDNDQGRRLLMQTKCNLGPISPTLAFKIAADAPRIDWEPDPVAMSASDFYRQSQSSGRSSSALDEACSFLRGALAGGKRPSKEIEEEATDAGISPATLRRARDLLGVVPAREGRIWVWSLLPQVAQDPQLAQGALYFEQVEQVDDFLP